MARRPLERLGEVATDEHERRDVPEVEEVVGPVAEVRVGQQAPRVADDDQGDERHLGVVEPGITLRCCHGCHATTTLGTRGRLGACPLCPRRQRVAAYAVIMRVIPARPRPPKCCCAGSRRASAAPSCGPCRVAASTTARTRATPCVREIVEETGLDATVGRHRPRLLRAPAAGLARRRDDRLPRVADRVRRLGARRRARAARPRGRRLDRRGGLAPARRGASTGTVPVVAMVGEALADHTPFQLQRIAAYALIRRGTAVLLTRLSDARPPPRPRGRCRAAASTTASRPPRRWPARSPRSAGSSARSARSSTSTTRTSPVRRRAGASRTSTACTWSSPPRSARTPSRASWRSTGRPTRWPGWRSPTSSRARVPVLDLVRHAVGLASG